MTVWVDSCSERHLVLLYSLRYYRPIDNTTITERSSATPEFLAPAKTPVGETIPAGVGTDWSPAWSRGGARRQRQGRSRRRAARSMRRLARAKTASPRAGSPAAARGSRALRSRRPSRRPRAPRAAGPRRGRTDAAIPKPAAAMMGMASRKAKRAASSGETPPAGPRPASTRIGTARAGGRTVGGRRRSGHLRPRGEPRCGVRVVGFAAVPPESGGRH